MICMNWNNITCKTKKKIVNFFFVLKPANPNSPLGVELTLAQRDQVKFLECHQNDNWWLVEDWFGQIGYVPASYVVVTHLLIIS